MKQEKQSALTCLKRQLCLQWKAGNLTRKVLFFTIVAHLLSVCLVFLSFVFILVKNWKTSALCVVGVLFFSVFTSKVVSLIYFHYWNVAWKPVFSFVVNLPLFRFLLHTFCLFQTWSSFQRKQNSVLPYILHTYRMVTFKLQFQINLIFYKDKLFHE